MEAIATTIKPDSPLPQANEVATGLGWRRVHRTRHVLLYLPWFGFACQWALAQSSEDWIAAFLAASGAFLLFFDAFRPNRLYCYPLSSLVLVGFGVGMFLGPLFFTAFEGNAITYNLRVPTTTFGHGVLSSLVMIFAHAVYRNTSIFQINRRYANLLLVRLKLFQPLRFTEVVSMGSLGIFASSFSSWFTGLAAANTLFTKVLEGCQFLTAIPAAFLLSKLWSSDPRNAMISSRKPMALFITFTVLNVVVATGRNSRGSILIPLSCLFLGLCMEWLFGLVKFRFASIVSFILAIVVMLPLVTDLATAMVMVRDQRANVSASELLALTFNQFQDREAISRYRYAASEIGLSSEWSENYVSNIFLSRFSNVKYPDNSLMYAARLSAADRQDMANFHWGRLAAILPSPFLSLVGVPESIKTEVNSMSFGDKLFSLATGDQSALGGFRGGHLFGSGMAAFGFSYLGFLFLGLLLVFPLIDAHAIIARPGLFAPPLISVVAITQFMAWFAFSSESVVSVLAFPIRGFIEPVLLFALIRWILAKGRFA